jgi:hypothetical protein
MVSMRRAIRLPNRRNLLRWPTSQAPARLGRAETVASGPFELDRLWLAPAPAAPPVREQWYRVDEAILRPGMPLLHLARVGAGYLSFNRALQRGAATETADLGSEDRYILRVAPEPHAGALRRVDGERENRTRPGPQPLRFDLRTPCQPALPLPLRIKLQPRWFLRLTLASVGSAVNRPSKELA